MDEMDNRELPNIIPPRSKFKLIRSDNNTPMWTNDAGRIFHIGYYSKQDGTDCIWLVNEKGEYEQTTDREALLRYFEPVTISNETDIYGRSKILFRQLEEEPLS